MGKSFAASEDGPGRGVLGSPQVSYFKRVSLVVKIVIPTALTLLWLAVPAAASIHTTNLGCGSGKLVLNVRYGVQNDLDTGTAEKQLPMSKCCTSNRRYLVSECTGARRRVGAN